jgi:protein-tyrosine phosphatase
VTDGDLQRLAELGVTLDVDLRNVVERHDEPDYLLSNDRLGNPKAVELSWLRAAFAEVDHLYGSVEAYARQGLGLDDATLTALRTRLLA